MKKTHISRKLSFIILFVFSLTCILTLPAHASSPTPVSIKIEGASEDTSILLSPGESRVIYAIVTYDDSNINYIYIEESEWLSDDTSIVEFKEGLIYGVSEGKTTIHVSYQGLEASAEVEVTQQAISELSISESSVTLNQDIYNQENALPYMLYVLSNYDDGGIKEVTSYATWTSSNPDVATVSQGAVYAVAEGTAEISATYGGKTVSAQVKVIKPVLESIELSNTQLSIPVSNDTSVGAAYIQALATYKDGSVSDISMVADWTSANPEISIIEQGLDECTIIGIAPGTTSITATYKDLSATVDVTVGTTIILQMKNPLMEVNGEEKEIDPGRDTAPVIVDGRTLLPIRALIEELGGEIEWDALDKKVRIVLNMITIDLWIGKTTATIDAEPATLDVAPQIINGRTMLPLRFISESLGYNVEWEASEKKVIITD